MDENKELIEYVSLLDGDHQTVQTFIDKVTAPIEYKSILATFDWSAPAFDKLDILLTELGYAGHNNAIVEIKKFLQTALKSMGVMKYNKLFNAGIWNHMDLLAKNTKGIDWLELTRNTNPDAIGLLKENPDEICWYALAENRSIAAIDLLAANPEKINWGHLSSNIMACDLLKANLDKVSWMRLSANEAAIEILTANQDKIDWKYLSGNPAAIDLLKANQDRIDWVQLSGNSAAMELLQQNQEKIDWEYLSGNTADAAIDLLKRYPENIDWYAISSNTNPGAIEIIAENLDKINTYELSQNIAATQLLIENPDYIDWMEGALKPIAVELHKLCVEDNGWSGLSANPYAIEILKANPEMIDLWFLSANSYDYYKEIITHFNGLKLFPRSHLVFSSAFTGNKK